MQLSIGFFLKQPTWIFIIPGSFFIAACLIAEWQYKPGLGAWGLDIKNNLSNTCFGVGSWVFCCMGPLSSSVYC
jgi:hypothetical protein